jgi:predicted HTH transcriptional regulator
VYVRLADQSLPAGRQLIRRLEKGLDVAPGPEAALSRYDKSILEYIQLHRRITLKQLMLLLNFSKRRAQRQLQDMLNKGLLRQYEHEQEDFWA